MSNKFFSNVHSMLTIQKRAKLIRHTVGILHRLTIECSVPIESDNGRSNDLTRRRRQADFNNLINNGQFSNIDGNDLNEFALVSLFSGLGHVVSHSTAIGITVHL